METNAHYSVNKIHNIRIIIAAFVCLFTCCIPSFSQLTEGEIRERAEYFFNMPSNEANLRSAGNVTKSVQSIHAIERKDTPYLYVANMQNGGWVILSNETKYTPVIGHSDAGEFVLDTTLLPPALSILLEHHMNNIDSLRASDNYASLLVKEEISAGTDVCAPILGNNRWKQRENNSANPSCDHSYNKLCPDFYDISCGRTRVGCSAVAMGQIMLHWQWPDYAKIKAHISMAGVTHGDLITRYYDWENMPLSINNSTPLYQVDAIAWLLVNCGYAANMVYAKNGSAAGIDKINSAMQNEFNYHTKRVHECAGTNMAPILKEELDNERPVLCQAWSGLFSSHSFVIDGYNTAGEFHINFGWGGSSNGYYNMGFNGYDANRTYLTEIYPNCTSRSANVNGITDTLIAANDKRTYYSTQQVSLCSNGNNLTIQPDGHLLVKAGEQIVLKSGFHAKAGSQVHLVIKDFQCDGIAPASLRAPQQHQGGGEEGDESTYEDIIISEIKISPNPVQDILQITSSEPIEAVAIYTLSGERVLQATTMQVDVSNLREGLYIVHAIAHTGSHYTAKVVKQ